MNQYMLRSIFICLLISSCLLFKVVNARSAIGFDVITMKNGDYHHGTVAQEVFVFNTDYGEISIPYHQMAELHIGSSDQNDLVITRPGDRFSGKLSGHEIIILRSQQPVLQLHLDDVATISFPPRKIRGQQRISSDAVELVNGDRFLADIQLNDFMLKSTTAIHTISHNDVYLIDFVSSDQSDEIRVQVTFNDRTYYQGQLLAVQDIEAVTRYGQPLKIPVSDFISLGYHVNYQLGKTDFNYRRRLNPASLIQDKMIGGRSGPEMVVLRGGDFQRGDFQGDGDSDEKPLSSVKLPAFAIGLYEVSFAEYDYFCDDTRREKPDDSGWGRGQRPVVNVSWNDARAYTEWLSRKTRQNYRLPSDAEWEYAARAGSTTRYWWGNELLPAQANCAGCGSIWDAEKTAPVGKLPPNDFGLHDTAGNVFEWVSDCFHTDFIAAPSDGRPLDKPGCGKRVIRGGAWSFPPREVRSANRWRDFPTRQSDDTGFRVVRELLQ